MRTTAEDFATQFILNLWNHHDLSLADTCISPFAEVQTTFSIGTGPNAFKQKCEKLEKTFTAIEFSIQNILKDQNKLIYTWNGKAVPAGAALSPQGNLEEIAFSGMSLLEIESGLITKYLSFSDILRVLNHAESTEMLSSSDIDYIISAIKDLTGRRLTKREVECLSLWLKGFSIKDTARALGGLSGRTVQTFRENIKRKLNVETYQQLFSLIQQSVGILILLKNQPIPDWTE